ncbi:thioredoxin family protein [Actinoplanes sp. NPDC049316]|uniref:TlpA family protein disulfide reductase n=1 Tax=Actinoplanes sp. NPDC049316 TaxID=3154727 RepID=UPI00342DAC90
MDVPGLIAVAAVLVVGVAAGVWRRSTDGRLRTVAGAAAVGAAAAGGAAAGGAAAGGAAGMGSASGESGGARDTARDDSAAQPERIDPDLLGALGVRAGEVTLLQFSSAFCAPCRAVRRVSSEVAGMLDGVRHVEVDAESHLDAVRALGIWKTPTLLVVGPDGRVARRATGVPGKPHLIAAVADLLPSR